MNRLQSGPENDLCALSINCEMFLDYADIGCSKPLAFHCMSILLVNNSFNL